MKNHIYITTFALLLCSGEIFAQSSFFHHGVSIQGEFSYGHDIPIDTNYVPVKGNASVTGICLTKQTDGTHEWEQQHHYPEIGLHLIFVHPGRADVYGQGVGFYPSLSFSKNKDRKIKMRFTVGIGLTWFSKKYGLIDDPNNIFSSHTNNITQLSASLGWKIAKWWNAELGVSMFHFSNSRYAVPNIGMNIPMVSLIVSHEVTQPVTEYEKRDLSPLTKNWFINLRAGLGITEMNAPEGPKYAVYNGALSLGKRFHHKRQLQLGVGYEFHEDGYAFEILNDPFPSDFTSHVSYLHVQASYEIFFGHLSLYMEAGTRVSGDFPTEKRIVLRNGLQYYFSKNIYSRTSGFYAGFYVRSYLGLAVWPEASIGYVMRLGKK